ncbi:hypothetical protein IDH44_21540 [Paenibacillus sp. IB182496]|uniref:Uncharacterized protein n=1 Tax=Paenibacillus sabuli TaxID=2772509 RepID=A0A927GU50_9BACL|nr:hypothetical protein [Paenibacillus sabuli]MBD2847785.1 hypothetical protein [Paenibacillus sabuli]
MNNLRKHRSLLIGCVGTTPNIGTTTAAFALAVRLAEQLDASVGHLCLNLKSAKLHRYLGCDRPAVTLDGLRPELRAGTLDAAKLRRACEPAGRLPNLRVLFGNLMRDQAEYYTPEEMAELLAVARETFAVTVVDVSAYWDNAATVMAMREADMRLLATTTALSGFQEDARRWIGQISPLFGVEQGSYRLVVMHPPWRENSGFGRRDVARETGLELAGELQLTQGLLAQLDSGGLAEWVREDKHGRRAMARVAADTMRRCGLQPKPAVAVRPWYRRLQPQERGGMG